MKKITSILSGLTLLFSVILTAQQTPHYTQYLYNMQIINPAYVGARADLTVGLLGRSQWVGVEGAPETKTFSLNGRMNNGLGLGLSAINDKIGLVSTTNVNIDASYTLVTSHYGRLSLGLKGGMTFFNNNLAQGITPDNEIYDSKSGNYPNVGIGAFYYNNRFFFGLSMPYMLKSPIYAYDDTQYTSGLSENINTFVSAGMLFDINEKLKFKPSTLVKYVPDLPISIDINANLLYDEKIEFGVSYRYNDSASAMVAVVLNKQFRIGYAYDYTLSDLGNNLGSHEIILLLDLDFKGKSHWLNNMSCYF